MIKTQKNKKGFTMVEMLVVIAIIAILVSIIIPVVTIRTRKAKAARNAANLRSWKAELLIDYAQTRNGSNADKAIFQDERFVLVNGMGINDAGYDEYARSEFNAASETVRVTWDGWTIAQWAEMAGGEHQCVYIYHTDAEHICVDCNISAAHEFAGDHAQKQCTVCGYCQCKNPSYEGKGTVTASSICNQCGHPAGDHASTFYGDYWGACGNRTVTNPGGSYDPDDRDELELCFCTVYVGPAGGPCTRCGHDRGDHTNVAGDQITGDANIGRCNVRVEEKGSYLDTCTCTGGGSRCCDCGVDYHEWIKSSYGYWAGGQCIGNGSKAHVCVDFEKLDADTHICTNCGETSGHDWSELDGICSSCDAVHSPHSWTDGVCDGCGMICLHNWSGNTCGTCGSVKPAEHFCQMYESVGSNGHKCSDPECPDGTVKAHTWKTGKKKSGDYCTTCGYCTCQNGGFSGSCSYCPHPASQHKNYKCGGGDPIIIAPPSGGTGSGGLVPDDGDDDGGNTGGGGLVPDDGDDDGGNTGGGGLDSDHTCNMNGKNNTHHWCDECGENSKVTHNWDTNYNDSQHSCACGKTLDCSNSNSDCVCGKPKASSGSNCVTPDTMITLADGSKVRVDALTGDELLLVWNMETGKLDAAPIMFVDSDPEAEYEVIRLYFSDGTEVKVISEHGFWDYDLNRYVYLDRNAEQYIGHTFFKHSGNGGQKVTLVDVVLDMEVTTSWSPVTAGHLCYFVNDMLSMPGGVGGLFNIFDVDPETMTYDQEALARDLETYGLFTYEELASQVELSEDMFYAAGGPYLKVSIGKGNLTEEELFTMILRYSKYF